MNHSKAMSRRTIVFDLGGVLIDWNPRHLYPKLFVGNEAEMEYFLSHVCSPEWNAEQDEGRPFSEAIAERSEAYPEYRALIQDYVARWPEMIGGRISGTLEVLSELRKRGYRLVALRKWSADTFPLVKDQFPFLDWFEPIVLSGAAGRAKPHPLIIQTLLDRIHRRAEEWVFVDDSPDNLTTACELGFKAIKLVSPEQVRADLYAIEHRLN